MFVQNFVYIHTSHGLCYGGKRVIVVQSVLVRKTTRNTDDSLAAYFLFKENSVRNRIQIWCIGPLLIFLEHLWNFFKMKINQNSYLIS